MNIALLGYGRMGRDVEQAATERGHSVTARFTSHHQLADARAISADLDGIDCYIDFSNAAASIEHIQKIAPLRIPLVVGTTGWHEHLVRLTELVTRCEGTLFHAANFSVGAHVFYHAVEAASELMDRFDDYDIAIHEVHHRLKKDAPSGTALVLAQKILDRVGRKTSIVSSLNSGQLLPHELLVTSSRVGSVAGTHSVFLDSPVDSLQLTHTAYNRRGFAVGAVRAAEWVRERTGVFTMDDFLFTE
jgi:4-hydroxy-tetrahydrodipicolinate reductase